MLKAGVTAGPFTYLGGATLNKNRKHRLLCNFCKKEATVWGRDLPSLLQTPICPHCGAGNLHTFSFYCPASRTLHSFKGARASDFFPLLPKGDYEIFIQTIDGPAKRLGMNEVQLNSFEWRNSPSFLEWRGHAALETLPPLPAPQP